jgi:hypothetical protein
MPEAIDAIDFRPDCPKALVTQRCKQARIFQVSIETGYYQSAFLIIGCLLLLAKIGYRKHKYKLGSGGILTLVLIELTLGIIVLVTSICFDTIFAYEVI